MSQLWVKGQVQKLVCGSETEQLSGLFKSQEMQGILGEISFFKSNK